MCGVERGSGVGLTAVVGGVALAGTAFAGALAHVCSKKMGIVNSPYGHDPGYYGIEGTRGTTW